MPSISLTIPGSIVSKKNSKIATMIGGKNCPRRPMILPSKAYKKWEKQARQEARVYIHGVKSMCHLFFDPPITCPVEVEAHFYYKGNRPDLSGACESIADCLQGILWSDDGQIESWDRSRMHHDIKNPRTEITVTWGDSIGIAHAAAIADEVL